MHDHATDGGRTAFDAQASARALRLHLDNAHDERTSGLDFAALAEMHRKAHKPARLAEIEAAANLISDRLGEAPPAVVERVVAARSMYLEDANGTVYLAIPAGVWDAAPTDGRYTVYYEDEARPDDAVPLYRLIAQEPAPTDLMEAIEESLAKARQTLAKTSETIPSDAPAGAPGPAAVDALPAPPSSEDVNALRALIELSEGWSDDQRARFILSSNWLRDRDTPPSAPGAPSSTAAPSLLGTGSAGAAVGPIVGGGEPSLPCRSDRPAPSGSTRAGGES